MGYQAKAIKAVLEHSKARGSDRLVLMVLATHADDVNFEGFPGRMLLCKEAGMEERNLVYCLKRLEAIGEIEIKRGSGRGNLTRYKILLPSAEKVQTLAPFPPQKKVQPSAPFIDEKVQATASFESLERVQNPAERVQNPGIKGAKPTCAYNEIEHSEGTIRELNKSLPTPSVNSPPSAQALARIFDEAFLAAINCPYVSKSADFVQLNKLQKSLAGKDWELTEVRFRQAVANYFASELGQFTLADLAVRFASFHHSPLDRFGKPIESKIATKKENYYAKTSSSGGAADHTAIVSKFRSNRLT